MTATTATHAGSLLASDPAFSSDVAGMQGRAVDAFLESFFRLRPVTASFAGIREFDHLLPDYSPEGLLAARAEMCRSRRELAAAGLGVLAEESLSGPDWLAIDGALADAFLELQLAEDDSCHFVRGNPSLAVGEAVFSVVSLAARDSGPVEQRVEAAISRLKAFPGFLHGARRTLGDAAVPDAWRERAVRECGGGIQLLADLAAWPVSGDAPVSLCRAFQEAATGASAALEWFRAFVAAAPGAPQQRYAAGHGLLEQLVRRGHWCDRGVERLRNEAREGLERQRNGMVALLEECGEGSWGDVSRRLSDLRPAAGDVLRACHDEWDRARSLSSGQVTWPGIPVRYRHMPRWALSAAPSLYYLLYRSPAALDYPAEDSYAVPVPDESADPDAREAFSRAWNLSAIRLNHVAHHGGLGHHVQNWHAARGESRVGRIAATDGACRIAMFAGGTMAEGWACYATEVLEELGFLTPDERISEQHMRVRLMVRAVTDLELHTRRMSFDDGVRMHMDVCGVPEAAARAEMTKCSMFPGTALMYWLGLRELWALRTAEETEKRSSFEARPFHDAVLDCGSIPVPLVSRLFAARRKGA